MTLEQIREDIEKGIISYGEHLHYKPNRLVIPYGEYDEKGI